MTNTTTHRIYINRAMVFDEGVKWATVAGLYPHAYVPLEYAEALLAERDALAAKLAAANADHAARVIAALDADLLAELVDFLGDFGSAKIDALRHDRGRSSPDDDPDPVVEAEQVWGWQEDARAILAKLGVQP